MKIIVKKVHLIDVRKIIQISLEYRVRQKPKKIENRERESKMHRGPICKTDLEETLEFPTERSNI